MEIATYKSPLGNILLAAENEALIALRLERQKKGIPFPEKIESEAETPLLSRVKDWLNRYFDGEEPDAAELPLAPQGSAFQKTVWQILSEIPYGKVATYGEIAKETASRMQKRAMSPQAVGSAVGHNPISIIIPCHRVVGANGNLVGYDGGIQKKVHLLAHEGVDLTRFFAPLGR